MRTGRYVAPGPSRKPAGDRPGATPAPGSLSGRGTAFRPDQRYPDAMKNRTLSGLLLAMLPALRLGASGCTQTYCAAVGFTNLSPVELELAALPADTSVSACFGVNDRCDPAPVTRDSSCRWMVLQTEPFIQPDKAPRTLDRIRVVAVKPEQSISDRLYGIEHTPPRGGCNNSFDLIPVKVL